MKDRGFGSVCGEGSASGQGESGEELPWPPAQSERRNRATGRAGSDPGRALLPPPVAASRCYSINAFPASQPVGLPGRSGVAGDKGSGKELQVCVALLLEGSPVTALPLSYEASHARAALHCRERC